MKKTKALDPAEEGRLGSNKSGGAGSWSRAPPFLTFFIFFSIWDIYEMHANHM